MAVNAYKSAAEVPLIGYILAPIAAAAAVAFGVTKLALLAAQPLPALASGAYVQSTSGGRQVVVGEGAYDEVVMPLSANTYEKIADGLLSALSSKLSGTTKSGSIDRSATVSGQSAGTGITGKLTIILQDAGQTLKEYIGDVVEDGSKSGQFIVYARGV